MARAAHRLGVGAGGTRVDPQPVRAECSLQPLAPEPHQVADRVSADLRERRRRLAPHPIEPRRRQRGEKRGLTARRHAHDAALAWHLLGADPDPQRQAERALHGVDQLARVRLGIVGARTQIGITRCEAKHLELRRVGAQHREQPARDLAVARHVGAHGARARALAQRLEHGHLERHAECDRVRGRGLHAPALARIAAHHDRARCE